MQFEKLKSFITVCVLLAFVGQSVAAVLVACPMMEADFGATDMGATEMADMPGMDHSAHAMHTVVEGTDGSESAGLTAAGCCGDGFCSMANCLSSPAMSIGSAPPYPQHSAAVLVVEYSLAYLNPAPISLFRPPIAR